MGVGVVAAIAFEMENCVAAIGSIDNGAAGGKGRGREKTSVVAPPFTFIRGGKAGG